MISFFNSGILIAFGYYPSKLSNLTNNGIVVAAIIIICILIFSNLLKLYLPCHVTKKSLNVIQVLAFQASIDKRRIKIWIQFKKRFNSFNFKLSFFGFGTVIPHYPSIKLDLLAINYLNIQTAFKTLIQKGWKSKGWLHLICFLSRIHALFGFLFS